MISVSDSEIIYASLNSRSAAEAAKLLGINYKTYKRHAERLGVFNTNQGLKGISGKEKSPGKDFRNYIINDYCLDSINNEVAYWLGFIAADGSVVNNTLRFVLNKRDRETLVRFLKFADSNYEIHEHKSHYTDEKGTHYFDAINLKITSEHIIQTLSKYGIVQNKKNMDIDFLGFIPDEYKIDFLIGFFDGDGSVSYSESNYTHTVTMACNHSMFFSICNILNNIGITYSISKRENIDIIYIHNIESFNIFKNMYIYKNNVYGVMRRKLNKFVNI